MREYNPLTGVPRFCYYIEETMQFGDFETPEEKRITFVSRNKQELIDLCKKKGWRCQGAWSTHEIKYRWLL